MQYVQHDFVNNVLMLHKTGQHDKAKSILNKEIAQLIIYHRGHVIQALQKAGIQTNKLASDKELTDKLGANLGANKVLQAEIAKWLVALNSPSVLGTKYNAGGFFGADAGAFQSGLEGAAQGAAGGGAVGAIGGAIGNIFGFFKAKQDAKTQTQANQMALAQALLQNQPQKKSNTGLYVGIGIALIAVGAGVYLFMKHNKSHTSTAALGATIPPSSTLPPTV